MDSTRRVDVVVEDLSQPDSFGIIEIKIWEDQADVQPRILEYVQVAKNNGLSARAENRLNLPDAAHGRTMAWAKPYLNGSYMWCAWADPLLAGNVYFWPANDEGVPHENYKAQCLNADDEEVRKRAEGEAAADAMKRMRDESVGTRSVMVFDAVGMTDQHGKETYVVTVLEQPTKARVELCYGDGTCDTASIPQGPGTQIFSFAHTFLAPSTGGFGPDVYQPMATVYTDNAAPESFAGFTTRDAKSLSESLPSWVEDEGWDTAQLLVLVATFVVFLAIAAPFIALGLILWALSGGSSSRADGVGGGVGDECESGGVHVLGVCIC